MKAISVRQPWAWLLIHGGKDIENRDWPTRFRGEIAIHAAKGITLAEYADAVMFVQSFDLRLSKQMPLYVELVRGAVIGTMVLRDCVRQSTSPWFQGRYGFVMTNPEPCDPVYVKGALGLWEWNPEPAAEEGAAKCLEGVDHTQPYSCDHVVCCEQRSMAKACRGVADAIRARGGK